MTSGLDTIYVTASSRDARFTRICVGSIRYFYPHASVQLLVGGMLERGLADELARYWDVRIAELPVADWGWGFVKLEPLFIRQGERFLVLDSDTVFSGRVLENLTGCNGAFLVDEERQTDAETHRLYYDWRKVAKVDSSALPPSFVFNSGQWFGTGGVLHRSDFAEWVDWTTMPPRLRHPGLFMPGEQGVLNYVLNQKVHLSGLKVERRPIMHWPGRGMDGLTAKSIEDGSAPPRIIHWAGFKEASLSALPGSDILGFFERYYYSKIPGGASLRYSASLRHWLRHWRRDLGLRMRMRLEMMRGHKK